MPTQSSQEWQQKLAALERENGELRQRLVGTKSRSASAMFAAEEARLNYADQRQEILAGAEVSSGLSPGQIAMAGDHLHARGKAWATHCLHLDWTVNPPLAFTQSLLAAREFGLALLNREGVKASLWQIACEQLSEKVGELYTGNQEWGRFAEEMGRKLFGANFLEEKASAAGEAAPAAKRFMWVAPGGAVEIGAASVALAELINPGATEAGRLPEFVTYGKRKSGGVFHLAGQHLQIVKAEAFASDVEQHAEVFHLNAKGEPVKWNLNKSTAELILNCNALKAQLPHVNILTPVPVLWLDRETGELRPINYGLDRKSGILVTRQHVVKNTLDSVEGFREAVGQLLALFEEFHFKSEADRSRAVACLMTPALVHGNFLAGRPPGFLAEANDSQTGKGYLVKLLAAPYTEKVAALSQRTGLGSLAESFSEFVLKGEKVIYFDNLRGSLDEAWLESFMTEPTWATRAHRVPFQEIETEGFILYFTSNGLSMTADLANRVVPIRLVKRPENFEFFRDDQGRDIKELVAHYRTHYLGFIWRVLQEWHQKGMPRTAARMNAFTDWAGAVDCIVTQLFELPSIMTDLKVIRNRLSDRNETFVRQLAELIRKERGWTNRIWQANDLVALADAKGLEIPGRARDEHAKLMEVGKIMAKAFGAVDADRVHRAEFGDWHEPGSGVPSQIEYLDDMPGEPSIYEGESVRGYRWTLPDHEAWGTRNRSKVANFYLFRPEDNPLTKRPSASRRGGRSAPGNGR